MSKRENKRVKNIKRKISADIRGTPCISFFASVTLSFVCGLAVIFGGMGAAVRCGLVFPWFTPSLFVLTILRIGMFMLLGTAFGLISGNIRGKYVYRYYIYIMLLVIGEIIWLDLLYLACVPFLCFFCAVFQLAFSVYILWATKRSCYTLTLIFWVYTAIILFRTLFSLCLMGVN